MECVFMSQQSQRQPTEAYQDLTEKQRAVINEYIRDDSRSYEEIADAAGVSKTYPRHVREEYGWIAEELTIDSLPGEEETSGTSGEGTVELGDLVYRVPASSVDEIESLTDKQKAIIAEFTKEDTPLDPDRDEQEIADAAGVTSTYVIDIHDEYGELAEQIKEHGELLEGEATSQTKETTEEGEEEPAEEDFPTKFASAVESGDVTSVTIDELRNGIQSVQDASVIRDAMDQDGRISSQDIYKRRLNALSPEKQEEPEEEPSEKEPVTVEVPVRELRDVRDSVDKMMSEPQ